MEQVKLHPVNSLHPMNKPRSMEKSCHHMNKLRSMKKSCHPMNKPHHHSKCSTPRSNDTVDAGIFVGLDPRCIHPGGRTSHGSIFSATPHQSAPSFTSPKSRIILGSRGGGAEAGRGLPHYTLQTRFSMVQPTTIGTISNLEQLTQRFLHHFSMNKRVPKTTAFLFTIRQKENEPLRGCMQRFVEAVHEVPHVNHELLASIIKQNLSPGRFKESIAGKSPCTMEDLLM
ncbi:UNVERIFIED_CONTAM: hypothetical protein Slati_2975400 [Sesamum latifolium]|uniref:Retrotransposon gag domain-containing protein n=1 Tax=Sesamum latifolium TaxID=2727402 RepID=A0AAW2VJU4_9LAMI